MNKKRDRLQIVHDILKAVQDKNGKIKPTHILYKSNLSHQMLDEYLGELISKGFIVENQTKTGKTYSMTPKGFEYLQKYRTIVDFIDSFGLSEPEERRS
jgi:predicted transcriptional regulator